MKVNIEKATLIPHTYVTHGIDDSNETNHAWMVWSQQHPNMTYKVPFPFTKYVGCTCEWALHGKLCKHQVVFLICTNFIIKKSFNIVRHNMDLIVEILLPYLQTLPICTFMTMNLMMKRPMKIILMSHGLLACASLWHQNDTSPNVKEKNDHNQLSSSFIPMEKMFDWIGDIMRKIINEVQENGV